jgi:mRNA interferase MazF
MTEGDLLLTSLVQSDGEIKRRPTVFLRRMPGFGDFLVCGISTQLQQEIPDFDEIIDSCDFVVSGLKAP